MVSTAAQTGLHVTLRQGMLLVFFYVLLRTVYSHLNSRLMVGSRQVDRKRIIGDVWSLDGERLMVGLGLGLRRRLLDKVGNVLHDCRGVSAGMVDLNGRFGQRLRVPFDNMNPRTLVAGILRDNHPGIRFDVFISFHHSANIFLFIVNHIDTFLKSILDIIDVYRVDT